MLKSLQINTLQGIKMNFFTKKTTKSIAINPLNGKTLKAWVRKQDKFTKDWVKTAGFKGNAEELLVVPNTKGNIKTVLFGISEETNLYTYAALPAKLPQHVAGYYINTRMNKDEATQYSIGWALGCYNFNKYKSDDKKEFAKLAMPDNANKKLVKSTVKATFMVRDLINTPANNMGPDELTAVARKLAKANKATTKVITGNDLLKKNYPAIYEVGKASPRKPRLIDIKWGNTKHLKVTLVGKGVCYDTGGLNLKPGNNMIYMKKDMGGAAQVLGLASMIMEHKLPIRLRLLLPVVENSVAGNSLRPSDIIKTRKGLSVEVGNTDAEGRLILADALTEASKEKPELVINIATLTGPSLGQDFASMFSNDDKNTQKLLASSKKLYDPMINLPLWQPYKHALASTCADTNNVNSGFSASGVMAAALFLEKFVEKNTPWIHLDTVSWVFSPTKGRTAGGDALGMRAVYDMLAGKFGKKK